MIVDQKTSGEIKKVFPEINHSNIHRHIKHMQEAIRLKSQALIDEEAIKARDSIKELTDLFDDWDIIMKAAKERALNSEGEEQIKAFNALKGLIQAKKEMIKLNMQLLGDTKEKRKKISLFAEIDQQRKKTERHAP